MSGKHSRLVNARIIFHLCAPEAIWTKATAEIQCRSRFSESVYLYKAFDRTKCTHTRITYVSAYSSDTAITCKNDARKKQSMLFVIFMLFLSELLLICVLNSVKQTGLFLWFGRSDRQFIFTCTRYQFSSRCSAAPNSILNRVIILFRTEDLNSEGTSPL